MARRRLGVHAEDVELVWPLGFQHINMLGGYSFDLAEPLTRGELRSLRDPPDPADEEILAAWTDFSFSFPPKLHSGWRR